MGTTTADFILERLHAWGVRRVFGYTGDGINGMMAALRQSDAPVRFVQSRHEELASMMACAHAKFTGEVGVCLATAGPGVTHLIHGLYDAKLDHMPVVALLGQQPTISMGSGFLQEMDLHALLKDVAHQYVYTATAPAMARHLIDQALRIAIAERTVTAVILPEDVQEMDAVAAPPRRRGATFSGVGYQAPRVVPTDDQLDQAADLLNASDKVAMLVGAGAAGASEQVSQAADVLGAGVAKALLGKTVLPDDLPWVTGAIGLLGTRPSWDLVMDCDALLMVGTSFPYATFLPPEGQARAVQIDLSAKNLGVRYPTEVNLHGDAKATLDALLPRLERKQNREWRKTIESNVRDWWRVVESQATADADPINPQRVFWELNERLPDHAIVTTDSGSATNWWARVLRLREGMMGSLSGKFATMGCALPYALAGKLAYPDRVVIATVGDGAMQMIGNNSLISVADHWQDWDDPRFVVAVLNNRDLNQVTWEQRVLVGDAKFEGSQRVPDFDYSRYAKQLGLHGRRIESPDDIAGAWDEALNADRPCVLDFVTDPDVPPLPPHITKKQAKAYLQSMFAGDPDSEGMAVQSAKQMLARWVPSLVGE